VSGEVQGGELKRTLDKEKINLMEKTGEYRIAAGGTPQIQIEALLAHLD